LSRILSNSRRNFLSVELVRGQKLASFADFLVADTVNGTRGSNPSRSATSPSGQRFFIEQPDWPDRHEASLAQVAPAPQVAQAIDEHALVALTGNVHRPTRS
jgi:hypothetical protein